MVDKEKRSDDSAIPQPLNEYMNESQIMSLRRIEGFGWELRFIRIPMFQDPVPVVFSADGKSIGILDEDGRVNLEHEMAVRDDP